MVSVIDYGCRRTFRERCGKGSDRTCRAGKSGAPLGRQFQQAEAATRYAEAGVWYDAIMAITDRIRANPANKELREQRAAFLDQVGLSEVAKNDLMLVRRTEKRDSSEAILLRLRPVHQRARNPERDDRVGFAFDADFTEPL